MVCILTLLNWKVTELEFGVGLNGRQAVQKTGLEMLHSGVVIPAWQCRRGCSGFYDGKNEVWQGLILGGA